MSSTKYCRRDYFIVQDAGGGTRWRRGRALGDRFSLRQWFGLGGQQRVLCADAAWPVSQRGHVPVLRDAVLKQLDVRSDGIYVDALGQVYITGETTSTDWPTTTTAYQADVQGYKRHIAEVLPVRCRLGVEDAPQIGYGGRGQHYSAAPPYGTLRPP